MDRFPPEEFLGIFFWLPVARLTETFALPPRVIRFGRSLLTYLNDGWENWLRPLWVAGSTDRRNTFCKLLSWGLIEQGLSWPFIELPCDCAELGLAMQGQIGATRKILAQQSVGVFA